MTKEKLKRLKQLGLAVLGTYVIAGCPSSSATSSALNNLGVEGSGGAVMESSGQVDIAEGIAEELVIAEASVSHDVSFEVCAAVENWQRPSEAEQAKQLGDDARYGEALSDDALKRASSQFWDHQAVSFTTYGLSARMEPVNLSGLWTVTDELWNCYEPETTVAINEGARAETWLLNQRITGLQWNEDRYVMTVEPAATGMQVVQFERVEAQSELPLEIVTREGGVIAVVSGDWQ